MTLLIPKNLKLTLVCPQCNNAIYSIYVNTSYFDLMSFGKDIRKFEQVFRSHCMDSLLCPITNIDKMILEWKFK